ncbi:MAG: PilN domain-containing protein [Rhodocyclaceae bacterium]|nr:PilN domain-containing protein [Rhodocyclaceae bacterium]
MTRRHVNLYDPRLRRQRDWLRLPLVVGAACVTSLIVAAAGIWVRSDLPALREKVRQKSEEVAQWRKESESLRIKAAATKPDAALTKAVEEKRRLMGIYDEILTYLERHQQAVRYTPARIMSALARQSDEKVWLTMIEFDPAREHLALHGRTLDPAHLSVYIEKLEREPVFQGRRFAAFELAAKKTNNEAIEKQRAASGMGASREKPLWLEFSLLPQPVSSKVTTMRGVE